MTETAELRHNGTGPELGDLDLSEIARAHPVHVIRLRTADLAAESLAVADVIDACEAAGVDPDDLVQLLRTGGARAGLAGLAVAWTIVRRAHPDLTWDVVRANYRLEVIEDPDPPEPEPGNGTGQPINVRGG